MKSRAALATLVALTLTLTQGLAAQDRVDPEYQATLHKIGSKPEAEAQLPLDAVFTDHTGKKRQLSHYFNGERPILLNVMFFDCQTICQDVTAGLKKTLREIDWNMGEEYNVITLSFDPLDGVDFAKLAHDTSIEAYGRDASPDAWPHLIGAENEIRRVTNTLGFQYQWNEDADTYAHPAVIYIMTPDGKLSRYYEGFQYAATDLKYSLLDAGEGKIGSVWDRLSFYCLAWDPQLGQWIPAAYRVMQVGGALTLLALGLVVWGARRAGRRHARVANDTASNDSDTNDSATTDKEDLTGQGLPPETPNVSLGTQP